MKIQELHEDRNFLKNDDMLDQIEEFIVTHNFKNKDAERALDGLSPIQQEKLKGMVFVILKKEKNAFNGITEQRIIDALKKMRVL